MKKFNVCKLSFAIFLILFTAVTFSACGEECSHANMSEVAVEPDCEKQGRTVHYCLDCDYEYSSDFVSPLGHSLKEEVVAPTCTEQGYTYKYCRCGYHFNCDYVEPLGHTLSVEELAPTCDSEGYKVADCGACGFHYTYDVTAPKGHKLKADTTFVTPRKQDGSTTYTCDCGFTYVGDYNFYSDIFRGAYTTNTKVLAKGIDVSRYQHTQEKDGKYKPLNWTAIKEQGYEFAILKAGELHEEEKVNDVGDKCKIDVKYPSPVYEMDYSGAKEAGLDVGVYFFSNALSVETAKKEAEYMLELLDGKSFEYPIFFDIEFKDENDEKYNLSKEALTDICVEFISILQENGYYAALYTNNDFLKNYLQEAKITTLFDVWYSRPAYNEATGTVCNEWSWQEKFGAQMNMWQFSHTGKITDSAGNIILEKVDMSYAYKDYPSLIKGLGYNGFEKVKSTNDLDGKLNSGKVN